MRLEFVLPRVKPDVLVPPSACPKPACRSRALRHHQQVVKPLRDTVYDQVPAHRYQCLRCGHTFRLYPPGVTHDHTSQRLQGLAVMLYLLGLSYGATSLALEALGAYLAKSTIYYAVQAAAAAVPGLKRNAVFEALKTPALGADVTSVKVKGRWLPLGLSVNPLDGLVLSIDCLHGAESDQLRQWLEPIAEAVGAEILVTDDADGFKTAADELGLQHQVSGSHVKRNTEALIDELLPQVAADADGSLAAWGISPAQAQADLERLGELMHERQVHAEAELQRLARRYKEAKAPRPGEKWSLAYRLKRLYVDRWELWGRLTRYRKWEGAGGERLDGTNNASERGIGWWIKERYRTMRGYKRAASAVNVSRLIAWCGNKLGRGGANLQEVLA
jgi:hypothetical protein